MESIKDRAEIVKILRSGMEIKVTRDLSPEQAAILHQLLADGYIEMIIKKATKPTTEAA